MYSYCGEELSDDQPESTGQDWETIATCMQCSPMLGSVQAGASSLSCLQIGEMRGQLTRSTRNLARVVFRFSALLLDLSERAQAA